MHPGIKTCHYFRIKGNTYIAAERETSIGTILSTWQIFHMNFSLASTFPCTIRDFKADQEYAKLEPSLSVSLIDQNPGQS